MVNSFVYNLVSKGLGGIISNTFFKSIEIIGLENVPQDQPVIICSNHNNQFMDAILISSTISKPVSFIIAAKSTRRPVIGTFSKALGGIPVERAQDLAKAGKGKIISFKNGIVKGEGTEFKKDFQIGFQITLPKIEGEFLVQQIISDTELKIKYDADSDENVSDTEFSSPYKIIPKINQDDLYTNVWNSLNNNDIIGIFPEGGSHDRTDFLPLKAGVCIMALGAMAKHNIQVNIVTCGLNYYACDKFRSKVIIEFGQPYKIPLEQADLYKTNKREAISELLHEIEYRLRDVTTSMPSYKELMGVMMARQIYLPEDLKVSPKEELALNRRFAKGYTQMSDRPEVRQLFTKIKEYQNLLKITSTDDYQVKKFEKNLMQNSIFFFYSLLFTLFYLLLALPGFIVNVPLGILVNHLSEKERIKCQRESKVKILGKDVVASYQIILALKFIPTQFFIFTLLFGFVVIPFFIPSLLPYRINAISIFVLLYLPYNYLMVLCSDRVWTHLKNMLGAFNGIFNEQQYLTLQSIRNHLQTQIRVYVNELGKEIFKNFEENKVIQNIGTQLPAKGKIEMHKKLGKAMKRISSTELMQRIFNVLEDIGI